MRLFLRSTALEFKMKSLVNLTIGHLSGEGLLKETSSSLAALLRNAYKI